MRKITVKMVDHKVSPGGTVFATYEPAGNVETGTFPHHEPSELEQQRQEQMKLEDTLA